MKRRLRNPFVLFCVLITACTSSAPSTAPTSTPPTMPPDGYRLAETLARAGRPALDRSGVDRQTFPYPVMAGVRSAQGYPIYLIQCNDLTDTCTDDRGHLLGSIEVVAKRLTPVRNADVEPLSCHVICVDNDGHIVGAPTAAMQAYLAAHPTSSSSTP